MYTDTLAQLWTMMAPSKKLLISTLLLISCISGFNHARAMQKDPTGDLATLPLKNTVLNSFTSFGYPKYSLIDIIKLYSDAMKTDFEPSDAMKTHIEPSDATKTHFEPSDATKTHFEPSDAMKTHIEPSDAMKTDFEPQVPDTDELLLANIAETNPRLTMNAAKHFDYKRLDNNDNDARKNEKKLYTVLNNQPVSYPDVKLTQANSVINIDCTNSGSNELCRRKNTTSDDTSKQLTQITLLQNSSTANRPHDLFVNRQEFTDDLPRMGTTNNDVNVNKRLFGRRVFATCNLDTIDIDLRFSENIDTGETSLLLTCSGNVRVNKCEGMCTSKVSPSVNHVDGFEKVCSCCREVSASTRPVTLTSCVLGDQEVVGYSLTRDVIEPTSCACRQCRN